MKKTCPTRRNTELAMLASLHRVYHELVNIDRTEIQEFQDVWSEEMLAKVIDVLQFLGDATQQLEGDGETARLLAVMWQTADQRLEPSEEDGPLISRLKSDLKERLQVHKKVTITDRHLLTTMLVPKYRQLIKFNFVSDSRRAALRRQLVELAADEVVLASSTAPRPPTASSSAGARPRKRPAVVMLDLDSDESDPDDVPEPPQLVSDSPRDTSLVYAEAEGSRYLDNAAPKVNTRLVDDSIYCFSCSLFTCNSRYLITSALTIDQLSASLLLICVTVRRQR